MPLKGLSNNTKGTLYQKILNLFCFSIHKEIQTIFENSSGFMNEDVMIGGGSISLDKQFAMQYKNK
jgi:hypothetical protein